MTETESANPSTLFKTVARLPGMNARDRRREIDRLTRRHARPGKWRERLEILLGFAYLLVFAAGFFWAWFTLFGKGFTNPINTVGKGLLWLLH